jgi:hypothetical protein
MIEYWNWFITEFCKMEFVCHQAEPNWLGWLVIAFGVFWAVLIPLFIIAAIVDS